MIMEILKIWKAPSVNSGWVCLASAKSEKKQVKLKTYDQL